jgi:sodium transport system permease protein
MNIIKIVKKELDKIFKFPRQILTTLVLPGLLLFLIYAFLGMGFGNMVGEEVETTTIIHVVNAPASLEAIRTDEVVKMKIDLYEANETDIENLKNEVLNGSIHAVLVYDSNFDDLVQSPNLPNVTILYDSSTTSAAVTIERINLIISTQQSYLYRELNINPDLFNVVFDNIEPAEKGGAVILAMILPMLLMSFIFASALGTGSDAIAGEKERGTLATLLMLPIKRSDIIIGKIISTSILTVISALSSFIGLVASLPFAKELFATGENLTISYGFLDILGLFVIILLIALLASSILLIISTLAKNVKEATTLAMPIYIAAIITPILSMFSSSSAGTKLVYIIPLYNTIIGLKEIISTNFDLVNFLLIIASTLIYVFIFIVVLIRLFKSEKVLYSK